MSDYLSPGVYIQELEGPAPIIGVSTSITGFVGVTERGPGNWPILIKGPGDYTRWFGGLLAQSAFIDPADKNRAHCYLPYSVAGFFTNLGQIAYVVRVVPDGATYATELLFDRTGLSTALDPVPPTTLVRSAAQGDGAVGGNPLVMLSPVPPETVPGGTQSWIRIGDGSASEYGEIFNTAPVNDAYPIDLPLQNFHAAGASFALYNRTALNGTYTLTADAAEGSSILLVQTASGTLTAAQLLGSVLEVATYDSAAVVIPASVTQTNATNFSITLTSPLAADISALPGVTLITPLTPAASASGTLDYAAGGGDVVLYAKQTGGAVGFGPNVLIDIDYASTASPNPREIRTIASSLAAPNQLTTFSFSQPNTIDWPAGTVLAPVMTAPNAIYAVSGSTLELANVTGIIPGSVLLLNGTSYATVASVKTQANQVTLTAAPASGVGMGSSVTLVSTSTLSANAAADSQQVVLTGRSGINAGTVLLLGASAPQEYAVVQAVPGIRALGADPGTVVLDAPLFNSYVSGAAAAVVNILPSTAAIASPPRPNSFSAVAGSTVTVASVSGIAPGSWLVLGGTDTVEVQTVDSATSQLTLTAAPSVAAPNSLVVVSSFSGSSGDTITVANLAGIIPGNVLLLGGTESVTVGTVNTGASQVKLTATPTTAAPNAMSVVSTTTLSAAVAVGAQSIALASRLGINAGSLLELGTAPTQEYALVLSVTGPRAAAPDPGNVILSAPLANAYATGANVVLVGSAPSGITGAPTGPRATQLVLDMPANAAGSAAPNSTGYVTWNIGWPAAATPYVQVLQVTLPDGTVCYTSLTEAPGTEALEAVTLAAPVQSAHPIGSTVVSRSPLIQVQALDVGGWGNRVMIAVQDESPGLVANAPVVSSLAGGTQLKLATVTGVQPGSYLEMLYTSSKTLVDPNSPLKVAAVNVANATITLDAAISTAQLNAVGNIAANPVFLRSREFRITVYLLQQPSTAVPARNTQVIQTETFRNLSMDPRHNQYFQTLIGKIDGPKRLSDNRPEGTSWLIRVLDIVPSQAPRLGPEALIDVLSSGLPRPAQHALENGDDGIGTISDGDYIGADSNDPSGRTGLYSLLNVPQISIVAIPGQGTPGIQAALISHCENALYRFAVLDPQYPTSAIADIQAQRQQFDTKFAAIYYPWFTIDNPFPVNLNNITDFAVPPSGYIAGIYAQVDAAAGVFKAPANVVVQGITGLTATLAKGDQDVLNPYPTNINVIRDFTQSDRGLRVWGARVITSDANFMYVPIKRTMMFIEKSLDVGLQDVVFQPNAPPLWASVERLISNFLTTLWQAGGLQGATAAQSFFVRCDLTTMTQTDIQAGRLIAQVGVALVYPAEFVIIQISLTIPATSN